LATKNNLKIIALRGYLDSSDHEEIQSVIPHEETANVLRVVGYYNQGMQLWIEHLNCWSELVDDGVGKNGRAGLVTDSELWVNRLNDWTALADDDSEVQISLKIKIFTTTSLWASEVKRRTTSAGLPVDLLAWALGVIGLLFKPPWAELLLSL
jgi:hypothetical protein